MRPDTGHISLRVVRSILTGAHPFELDIEGQRIRCSVAPGATPSWPAIEGLTEASDGPWPADVDVTCAWEGGQCTVTIGCDYWKTKGKYRHWLGLRVRLKGRPRELVWITVPRYIRDAEDGYLAQLRGNISTVKRKVEGGNERARAVAMCATRSTTATF